MRAVSLSDATVQEKIAKSFVPLKVTIPHGTPEFPLGWPSMKAWIASYKSMGGEKCQGMTGCSIVSPDLEAEYANTGSSFVWEMFETPAYDAVKFAAMLDRGAQRWTREREIRADASLAPDERDKKIAAHRAEVRRAIGKEGQLRLPPKGFTPEKAIELFTISGDLPAKP
jgi:hypothetical protein